MTKIYKTECMLNPNVHITFTNEVVDDKPENIFQWALQVIAAYIGYDPEEALDKWERKFDHQYSAGMIRAIDDDGCVQFWHVQIWVVTAERP